MKDLLKISLKLLFWAVITIAVIIGASLLYRYGILSVNAASALILSIPFWACLIKTLDCIRLMKYGLPATGYFSVQTRFAHLRYVSADGTEQKGSCDLLTRRMLKKATTVPIWYDAAHPERFTSGGREVLIHAIFCVIFASVPFICLIR